jgi:hypothetical protein
MSGGMGAHSRRGLGRESSVLGMPETLSAT